VAALRTVRAAVAETAFPLPLPSAPEAVSGAAGVLGQIDDYLLPRLTYLDAPLLVVVGGSTGAGKSTLVNSLVRAPVSATGILRPTTRAPVLVSHPADTAWFGRDRLLAALTRTLPEPLQLISAPALPRGLAFLDAPDIDSVVDSNRALASQLFAAADLWLFVTSAARYADAVPWRLLQAARARGTVIALALARVPPAATVELVGLVSEMLTERGLASVPLFVIPETRVDRQGQLPESATEPLRTWFDGLAGDQRARTSVIRCTLDGALAALPAGLTALAGAAEEQLAAAELLAEQVGLAYGVARGTIERGVRGSPARRAPDPRPLDEFSRAVRTSVGNWRDRLAGVTGRRAGTRHRQTATEAGLVTLVRSAATDAAEQTGSAWRAHPAGPALLREQPGPSPELVWQVQRIIREQPREAVLEAIGQLLDAEAARWLERLVPVPQDGSPARQLREAAVELDRARRAAHLTTAAEPEPEAPEAPEAPEESDLAPEPAPTTAPVKEAAS
jgi:energy-coupling factor transporter ATP-binding protein EcfA2